MRVTRTFGVAAAGAVVAIALTGCFAGGGPETGDGERVTLRLAHGWVGETPQSAAFVPAIESFQADHPEIELVVEEAPGNGIGEKIATEMAAGEEPDVFLHWGIRTTSNYIEGGRVADLGELLEADPEVAGLYDPGAFRAATLGEGVYGLPMNSYTHMYLYDAEALDAAGASVPTTVEGLVDAAGPLLDAGTIPVSANGTAQRYLLQLYIAQLLGSADAVAEYARGGEIDDAVLVEAAQAVMGLREAEAFPDGAETLETLQSLELYNAGNAASYYQDSWTFANLSDETADRTTVALPPAIDPASAIKTLSSCDYFIYMSQNAYDDEAKRAAAWELMTYLAGPEVGAQLVEVSGFPSPILPEHLEVDDSAVPSVIVDTLALRDELGVDGIAPRLEEFFNAEAAAAFTSLAERLFTGEVTPEQMPDEMATVVGLNR